MSSSSRLAAAPRCAVLTWAAALLACGASGAAAVPAPIPGPLPERMGDEVRVQRVARDAYVLTYDRFHASNVLVVRMDDGSLVICSSPFDTEGTRAMVERLKAHFHPPRIVAINTHFHQDGTGGNEAYAALGVETWASDATQALLTARGEHMREESAAGLDDEALGARVRRTRVVPAARTFPARDGLRWTIAGEPVRVLHPGPGHSPDNVVVHFPRRGLLFGGCLIKAGRSIGFVGDADLDRWDHSVRALEPLGARVVVPGHGPIGGPELLANTIELVQAARAAR